MNNLSSLSKVNIFILCALLSGLVSVAASQTGNPRIGMGFVAIAVLSSVGALYFLKQAGKEIHRAISTCKSNRSS